MGKGGLEKEAATTGHCGFVCHVVVEKAWRVVDERDGGVDEGRGEVEVEVSW